jgi:hypothetical protein
MKNAPQLLAQLEALTGPFFKQNRYDNFNTCTQGVQRQGWSEGAARPA